MHFVVAGFLTQQLSWVCPHHSTPAGPCLHCASGLKHDRLVIQANGFGEDTAGQGRTAAPTQPTVPHHNYWITCRQRNQAEHQFYQRSLALNMKLDVTLKIYSTAKQEDWNQTWIETLSHSRDRSLCGGVSQLHQSQIIGWRCFSGKQHITHNITDSVKQTSAPQTADIIYSVLFVPNQKHYSLLKGPELSWIWLIKPPLKLKLEVVAGSPYTNINGKGVTPRILQSTYV